MISGKEPVEELIEKYPDLISFLLKKEMACIECGEPVWGTLEELLQDKDVKDIPAFIAELNKKLDLN